jgi:hypothetical protein
MLILYTNIIKEGERGRKGEREKKKKKGERETGSGEIGR